LAPVLFAEFAFEDLPGTGSGSGSVSTNSALWDAL
jgi:hypothetical protein